MAGLRAPWRARIYDRLVIKNGLAMWPICGGKVLLHRKAADRVLVPGDSGRASCGWRISSRRESRTVQIIGRTAMPRPRNRSSAFPQVADADVLGRSVTPEWLRAGSSGSRGLDDCAPCDSEP